MLEAYLHNYKLNRLEPLDSRCCFCHRNESETEDSHYYIKLYKVNNRIRLLVYNSIKYSSINIGVARCKKCFEIHPKARIISNIYAWVVAIVVALIFVFIFNPMSSIVGFMIGFFIGYTSSIYVEEKIFLKHDILSINKGTKNIAKVTQYLLEGWTIEKPKAY